MDWARLDTHEAVWVSVDVETTGLEVADGHRVCEVAAVRGAIGKAPAELDTLIHPRRTIPTDAVAVSGITDAHVAEAPPFAEVAPSILDILCGAVIVAHNAPFDVGFLEMEFGLVGLKLPAAPVIDTTVVAQVLFGLPVRNLAAVTRALRTPHRPKHRAIDDARATRDVLVAGIRKLEGQEVRTVGELVDALLPPGPFDIPLIGSPLPAVREALRNGVDVSLTYEGREGLSERIVRPIRLEARDRHLVLAAFCRTRQAPRTFRVERIVRASIVGG